MPWQCLRQPCSPATVLILLKRRLHGPALGWRPCRSRWQTWKRQCSCCNAAAPLAASLRHVNAKLQRAQAQKNHLPVHQLSRGRPLLGQRQWRCSKAAVLEGRLLPQSPPASPTQLPKLEGAGAVVLRKPPQRRGQPQSPPARSAPERRALSLAVGKGTKPRPRNRSASPQPRAPKQPKAPQEHARLCPRGGLPFRQASRCLDCLRRQVASVT